MLTLVTAEVSCDPVAMDPETDPDRTVFFCRDTHPARDARAAEVHVRCSGALSKRVLQTVRSGDRVAITGSARFSQTDLGGDVASGSLDIEATDVQLMENLRSSL